MMKRTRAKREVKKENAHLAMDLVKQPAGKEAGRRQRSDVRGQRTQTSGQRP